VLRAALKPTLLAVATIFWLTSPALPRAYARPDEPGDTPASLYRVTLPASDREARAILARQGLAIDFVGQGTVAAVVDDAALRELKLRGLQPLSVAPLGFPPADSAYHDYAEVLATIQAAHAAHPEITAVTEIGLSVEGRALPAVKISDQAWLDEPDEPAVLFLALHHAREHLTAEMALEIIRLFTDAYGTDPGLTNLVNQREIWVVPMVNPDGGEYDTSSGIYGYWRKNRRPNPDGTYGVDLNRNYSFGWGGEGSSSRPNDETYRGPAPFSEPETQAVRDFAAAHGNITAAISFHSYGELILYPFGNTVGGIPPDMPPADRDTFVELAARMAGTNGYFPEQASDLYPVAGDTCDWLYAERGAFCFTFEMYPATPNFYPPGSIIDRETRRNDAAVAYLTAAADNPRKVVGVGGDGTPPSVSMSILGDPPLLVGRPLTLTANATDDVGVTLVSWQADGEDVGMTAEQPFEMTWIASSAGDHVLQALAFDAGGNLSASEPVTVSVGARAYFPFVHP